MEQIGGEMNELLSHKMCSPMMIYLAVVVTSGLSVFLTRQSLKRHNTNKMDNLFNLYSLNELKFMIVFGLILFGLCQYNKTTLAWVFLLFPVIYVVIQNLIVHIHVSSAIQSAPKEVEVQQMPQYAAQVVPQDTQQSKPPPVVAPAIDQTPDMPVTTRSSQLMGGSSDFSGVSGSGASNYAYF
tara:strand:+ start:1205 stop:1753 length:549 start_codon:yes stop_codon:yes gene_type:complete